MPHDLPHDRPHQRAARLFLAGQQLPLDDLEALLKRCVAAGDVAMARQVLAHARLQPDAVPGLDEAPREQQDRLAVREVVFTSKDPEHSAAWRHDEALRLLARRFGRLDDPALTDPEVLGVAGGICKRRWQDLGQLKDLQRAAAFYTRGASAGLGDDAYCQVNAAFLERVLAALGDNTPQRLQHSQALWQRIVDGLPAADIVPTGNRWWNAASRAEALFGLGRVAEATACIRAAAQFQPQPWEMETTVRQLAHLARLLHAAPLQDPAVRAFFDLLVPGSSAATLGAVMGRVGLALSGGGFRAAFYHLGVLARLAELDALRHVSVLSCVSGGSIVGACYWLVLRKALRAKPVLAREDYIALVQDLIRHVGQAVDADLRAQIQPSRARVAWRVLVNDQRGLLDPEQAAQALHARFYAPLVGPDDGMDDALWMHQLPFVPAGHVPRAGQAGFSPGVDNWLRRDKVPELVINATTLNTGHGWQFTPTWMGESPWTVHEAADAVPRLEWAWYEPRASWQMGLAHAVAASASVPGVFAPLALPTAYEQGVRVRLVDGGVHDNQGTVALLASNCNIVLVSDACGQLMLEHDDTPGLAGIPVMAGRAMNMLMERVRQASFGDLQARKQSGLLQGCMFLHMKAGLDSGVLHRVDSQASRTVQRQVLAPSGVRKDVKKALAELRTDLDDFSPTEQLALMACGYQMACHGAARDLAAIEGLLAPPPAGMAGWVFADMHALITSADGPTPERQALLQALHQGAKLAV
ncbi:MAG: patatin-like phospholipase family protein [Pseudomonadota bacterium]